MVNVDTVYQRVLALANKEQRGYITPQEFNLFACQAQMEIIEQYFYDINRFGRFHGNDTEYSDMLNLLNEKVSEISQTHLVNIGGCGTYGFPPNMYKLGTVTCSGVVANMVSHNELINLGNSPLTRPRLSTEKNAVSTPVYVMRNNGVEVHPCPNEAGFNYALTFTYVQQPKCAYWGYVLVDEKAMYNPDASVNFIVHASDESELVNRILGLAGVTIQKPELVSAATQFEQLKQTSEKQ